jgi:hypothetical protein
MDSIFDLECYRKFNKDLQNYDDTKLQEHYKTTGKYQMRIYHDLSLFKKEKIYIFTTKFGYYISHVLQYLFFKNFMYAEIVYKINPRKKNLYVILFSQKVKVFPENYIIYQLEQKDISTWIDKKYELSILFSKKTWDYSQSNIDKFPEVIKEKMIFAPIPMIPYNYIFNNICLNNPPSNKILFYGSLNSRRKEKLFYLQKKLKEHNYFIKIISNKYGEELFKNIIDARIVINIHFYEDAILETCRINEILSCNKLIISEKSNPIDNNNYLLFKDKVVFVDNMENMYNKLIYYLDEKNKVDYDDILKNNVINNFDINSLL